MFSIDDREKQIQVFKALNDEIDELQSQERELDSELQKLLNEQDKQINEEQKTLVKLSSLKDELASKKMQMKYFNEKINEARKKQDDFYDQLNQCHKVIEENNLLKNFNGDLIDESGEESFLQVEHQLLLEQKTDIEKQIGNYKSQLGIYETDFKNNEKQLEILQSKIEYLERDLRNCQEKQELYEKDLFDSKKRLDENQNEAKDDKKQLKVLNEKFSHSNYRKTFIKELIEYKQKLSKKQESPETLIRIEKDLDQMPASLKKQLEEIDNRRKIIANDLHTKQTKVNNLKKDLEKITTTTAPNDVTEISDESM